MPYLLGIDVGSSSARAAVCRRGPGPAGWGPPEPVAMDVPPAVPGLFRLCGDDVPVFFDDLFMTPEVLVVDQARRASDVVWEREQEGPERVALAYPSGWGPGRVGLLRAALDDAGMGGFALVTRARAVVERHRATGRPVVIGRPVAVCRIGGAGSEVTMVIPREPGRLELLGSAEAADVGGDELAESTPADARALLGAVLDLFRRAARACRVSLADLAAVLLAGGGAGRPLVAEVLAESIAAPVLRDDDPWLTVARGAALSVRPPTPAPDPLPVPRPRIPVSPTDMLPVLTGGAGTVDPGEIPPRPPVHVPAPPVGRR